MYDFADNAADNPTFYADLTNPHSLNKYQYTYNNSINLVDPDGHCPVCPFDPQGPSRVINGLLNLGNKALDVVQTGLSAVGLIPGVGEGADATNAVISGARGNYVEAAGDGLGALGPGGSAVALGNRIRKVAGKADDVADTAKAVVVHGNSAASTKPQTLYEIVDQSGDVKKVGISGQTPNKNGTSPGQTVKLAEQIAFI